MFLQKRKLAAIAALMVAGVTTQHVTNSQLVDLQATAAEPASPADNIDDTKPAPKRPWDPKHDFPPHVSNDKSVAFDYPVV